MKHAMSLEATLDQLVSNFVQALLEAALRSTPSDFAAALGPNSGGVPSSTLSTPMQGPLRVRPKRAPPPSSATRAHPPTASSEEAASPPLANSPTQGEEASPAHAITDPALLLRAIDDATTSPEPEVPGRIPPPAPALLATTESQTSTGSMLRAGEEVLRKTGGGMVFRRTSPRQS
jgi:hypothetical protein